MKFEFLSRELTLYTIQFLSIQSLSLSGCLYNHLSIYLFLCLLLFFSLSPFIYLHNLVITNFIPSFIYRIHSFIYLSTFLYICQSIQLYLWQTTCHKSVYLNQPFHVYVSPSVYPSVCFSTLLLFPFFSSIPSSAGSNDALPACQRRWWQDWS